MDAKRIGSWLIAAALAFAAAGGAQAGSYPERPITLIVPYPPGASTDSVARMVASSLGRVLKQSVIVENRPGGETTIGTNAVGRAPADGYTVLMQTGTFMTALSSLKNPGYTLDDFTAISPLIKTAFVLMVPSALPSDSLEAYFAYARSHPATMNNGTLGAGATVYTVMGDAVASSGRFKWTDIPYKGGMEGVQALMSNQIQAFFATVSLAVSEGKQPRLKVLAVADTQRSSYLPGVPTFAELGYPDVQGSSLYGLYVRTGTPPQVQAVLIAAMREVMASAIMRKGMADLSLDPYPGGLTDFKAEVRTAANRFHADAQRLGLAPR